LGLLEERLLEHLRGDPWSGHIKRAGGRVESEKSIESGQEAKKKSRLQKRSGKVGEGVGGRAKKQGEMRANPLGPSKKAAKNGLSWKWKRLKDEVIGGSRKRARPAVRRALDGKTHDLRYLKSVR